MSISDMSRAGQWVLIAAALATCLTTRPALAAGLSELTYSVRGLASVGNYEFDASRTQRNGGFAQSTKARGERSSLGAGLGGQIAGDTLFADLALEYQDVDLFSLTDITLLFGGQVSDTVSLGAGVRAANQGEDFGDDDFYRERGYFVVIGAGGWQPWDRIGISGSLAYNRSQIELQPGGRDLPAGGFSAKLQAALSGSPHAIGLRARRFRADDVLREDEVSVKDELRETYLSAYYQYTWVR